MPELALCEIAVEGRKFRIPASFTNCLALPNTRSLWVHRWLVISNILVQTRPVNHRKCQAYRHSSQSIEGNRHHVHLCRTTEFKLLVQIVLISQIIFAIWVHQRLDVSRSLIQMLFQSYGASQEYCSSLPGKHGFSLLTVT